MTAYELEWDDGNLQDWQAQLHARIVEIRGQRLALADQLDRCRLGLATVPGEIAREAIEEIEAESQTLWVEQQELRAKMRAIGAELARRAEAERRSRVVLEGPGDVTIYSVTGEAAAT